MGLKLIEYTRYATPSDTPFSKRKVAIEKLSKKSRAFKKEIFEWSTKRRSFLIIKWNLLIEKKNKIKNETVNFDQMLYINYYQSSVIYLYLFMYFFYLFFETWVNLNLFQSVSILYGNKQKLDRYWTWRSCRSPLSRSTNGIR